MIGGKVEIKLIIAMTYFARDETTIDYLRMLGIVKDAGYRGYVGIEYEGQEFDEYEGIRVTKELMERVRMQLS